VNKIEDVFMLYADMGFSNGRKVENALFVKEGEY